MDAVSTQFFIVLSWHLLRKHSNCMLTVSSLHLYLFYNGSQPISDDFSDSTYIFAPLWVNKYLKTAGTIHRLAIYASTMSWVLIWLNNFSSGKKTFVLKQPVTDKKSHSESSARTKLYETRGSQTCYWCLISGVSCGVPWS